MTTILTTTGISLYTNTGRTNNTETPTDEQMRQYLRQRPRRAAAEANSLLQMSRQGDRLVLLHTQQTEAIRCAHLLEEYFRSEGYQHVHLIPLAFQSDPKQIETTGLRDLIDALINEIDKAQRNQQAVVINATAGFKAQVVYGTMIGMIYQVPVQYIYEDFQTAVTFNPIAVEWDTSLFLTYEAFFQWIDAQQRTYQEVEHYLASYPDRERIKAFLTPPDTNGEVFLSYMGDALRRKFQREKEEAALITWPPPASEQNIADKIANSINKRNHHPIKGGLEACKKIAEIDCVEEIVAGFYENTTRTAIKRVFEDGSILLIWTDNTKGARFTIYTTARGKPQTLKVAQKIKEILGID